LRVNFRDMHWTVGDVRITKVLEHELLLPLRRLVVDPPADLVSRHPWLEPDYITVEGDARVSIHGLVIDTGQRRILVDTCVGGEGRLVRGRPALPSDFLGKLADAGYHADDIDTVVCTHLHFDHVGWNTHLVEGEWRPTFPAARYLFAQREWEHWRDADSDYVELVDTVQPLFDADVVDLVGTDHVVCDEVRLEPAPGHTPGHVVVVIESNDERAVITGDLFTHPLLIAEPQLVGPSDSDPAQRAATAQHFRAERLVDGALVIGTHFVTPTAGFVVADGDTCRFVGES
jgi:glyoxylase-like metal-dependent hydrolase (beta-lactamase superfamily II)